MSNNTVSVKVCATQVHNQLINAVRLRSMLNFKLKLVRKHVCSVAIVETELLTNLTRIRAIYLKFITIAEDNALLFKSEKDLVDLVNKVELLYYQVD